MKRTIQWLAAVLALCMILCLCACTEDPVATESTPPATSTNATTTAPTDDGKTTYTVTVTDEKGNPIVGAMVQMCKDACVPAVTDAKGVATYSLPEAEYKVSFLSMPAGYTYSTDATEFYFADGETALTIVLKAAS